MRAIVCISREKLRARKPMKARRQRKKVEPEWRMQGPWKHVLTAELPYNRDKLLEDEISFDADAVDLR